MRSRKGAGRFPLTLHPTGQFCKKFRGRTYYFGKDRAAALERFRAEWADILAGRTPRSRDGGRTVADLANHFLTAKRDQLRAGDLTPRMWSDYHATCEVLVGAFGRDRAVAELRPEDFGRLRAAAAERFGPVSLGNYFQRAKTVFKYGFDSGLLEAPVRYGQSFDRPSKRAVRLARADRGSRLFAAADLRRLIDAAGPQMRAMILLGVNCGFGQTDCAQLTRQVLAARPGWLDFRRPKTGTPRLCPLWPETAAALEAVESVRPVAARPEYDRLVFLSRSGRPWVRVLESKGENPGCRVDRVGQDFATLARGLGIAITGFYALRHTFRTVADQTLDPVACGLIMGHVDDSMAGQYRERVADERLLKVTDHVRTWLLDG